MQADRAAHDAAGGSGGDTDSGEPAAGKAPARGHVARKREQRFRRILRTAAVVFAERGYEAASLEEIAARLDMRGPSLYHYVDSKDALLDACVTRTAQAVTARAEAIRARPEPARSRLRRLFVDQVLVQVRDYPEFIALFLRLQAPSEDIQEHIRRLRREHGDVFRRVVADGVADGSIHSADPDIALMLAFGALSYLPEWYDPGGPLSLEKLAEQLADRLLQLFL